ncbi:hypothetical protein FE784_05200 [Paenibacillus hemerocallicola]|uniref:UDP-N-acetylmuramyl pentapeptide phosphotransferase n=1 Tax=Paenibacillus hemerocallicola TaxID=1172614 RepID=A0A5C4TE18_9BACL|nr:hypothetical protein [Paenibacillus hemerocallicola]TNJ67354.1 hypothetical protein FE784_05200 [Paenibacillus hemerocallicola]
MIIPFLSIVCLYLLGRLALPAVVRFLRQHGLVSSNYAGDIIPVGTGVVLIILFAAFYTGLELTASIGRTPAADTIARGPMAAFLLVFAVGWLDDSVGDRTVKGLGGHWRKWRDTRTLSTGVVKAAVIVVAALWIVLRESGNFAESLVDWITIVLSANALNLLDVRPGRAWKGFYIGAAILIAASADWTRCVWLLPSIAGGLALMPGDLKGKHMLGDCGSNLLGFVLGCTMAIAAPVWLQATGLFMLAAMHRTAERSSITAWIERHKWVRWLDRFGRA